MYTANIDTLSPFQVNLPTPNDGPDLINSGESFVTHEETLPPELQSPLLPEIRELLQQCTPSQNVLITSEAQRTMASEAVKRLDEQAKVIIRKIHRKIDLEYMETPEAAEQWGFQVKQSTRNILMPKTRPQRLALLNAYIAKEESRPAEERFTTPDLAEVVALRDDLKANLAIRRNSQNRRKASLTASNDALKALYDCMRTAGAVILIKHFNRTIHQDMTKWGFEVIRRQAKGKEADDAPAANGTTTTPTNGSEPTTNGAATTTSVETTTTNGAETPAETSTNGSVDLNGTSEVVVELGGQG